MRRDSVSVLPKKVSWRRLMGLASRFTHLKYCQLVLLFTRIHVLTGRAPKTASMLELPQPRAHIDIDMRRIASVFRGVMWQSSLHGFVHWPKWLFFQCSLQ
jgi:hypothetical protein